MPNHKSICCYLSRLDTHREIPLRLFQTVAQYIECRPKSNALSHRAAGHQRRSISTIRLYVDRTAMGKRYRRHQQGQTNIGRKRFSPVQYYTRFTAHIRYFGTSGPSDVAHIEDQRFDSWNRNNVTNPEPDDIVLGDVEVLREIGCFAGHLQCSKRLATIQEIYESQLGHIQIEYVLYLFGCHQSKSIFFATTDLLIVTRKKNVFII